MSPTRLGGTPAAPRSGRHRRLAAAARRAGREQHGQVLPLLALAIVGLLALGVLVFELAFSTKLASVAQSGADAAALAGENEVVQELDTPPGLINPVAVRQAADYAAGQNTAHVINMQMLPEPTGEDVLVTVQTNQTLPSGSVDLGSAAVAEARASTDPFSSSATQTPISGDAGVSSEVGDASVSSGPRFVPHGGQFGFFPSPSANYSVGVEPEIAGRLDALGRALHLHLVGISGYRTAAHSVAVGGTTDDPHTCGAASDTPGVQGVPEGTLERFGLTRPFPNDPREADHIQLAGTNGSVCVTGSAAANVGLGGSAGLGNPNVHLVSLTGGPQGSPLGFGWGVGAGLGPSAGWAIPWAVVNCESGGQDTGPNSAAASGYYQITTGTWNSFGGYQAAYLAPKSIQDAKAAQLIATRGLQPWASSEPCWGPVLGLVA